jgi:lysine 2,3-aminomutase
MTIPIWRQIQRENFTDWKKLFLFLNLDLSLGKELFFRSDFPLNLPKRLASKIKKSSVNDPILKQFLPTKNEEVKKEGFSSEPVEDQQFLLTPRLVKKYQGRALILISSACAMHCRYCFRQNFPYETSHQSGFEEELREIEEDPSIFEVIFSGGDPLSLSNEALGRIMEKLSMIPHVKILRFHSRFPIGIPERIDKGFLRLLKELPLQVYFIIHANHPNELDEDIFAALKKMRTLGINLLCQSVLLKEVNDNVSTLKELCEKLIENGILPFYLHQLDRVSGTHHFEVDEERGVALIEELTGLLPGYAVFRYVREIPGMPSKTPLTRALTLVK